jgi:hypothetical protein
MKTWWVVASLLVSTAAFAQEPYVVAQPADPGPEMLPNLLSARAGTTVDVGADYVDLDGASDVYLFAFRAHAQYISPQGMGGYVMVPVAMLSGDGAGDSEDTQLGNIEVGGLYSMQQSATTAVLLRGGVSIDTQDAAMDELGALNLFAQYIPHPTDAFTAGGLNTTWARGQAQVVNTSGNIKFGGMIGVDVPVAGDVADMDNLSVLINAAASIGYHDPKFGLAGGFTFIQSVSDGNDDNIKHLFLGGNMAVNPATRVSLGIAVPLDNEFLIDGTAFMLGVRAGM